MSAEAASALARHGASPKWLFHLPGCPDHWLDALQLAADRIETITGDILYKNGNYGKIIMYKSPSAIAKRSEGKREDSFPVGCSLRAALLYSPTSDDCLLL